MAKYIDEDKLVDELDKLVADYLKDNSIQCSLAAGVTADIRDTVLNEIPAADVVPVKHGEWKWGYSCGQYGIWCTNCGAGWVNSENAEWIASEHIYCPKCGAKMKGGAE